MDVDEISKARPSKGAENNNIELEDDYKSKDLVASGGYEVYGADEEKHSDVYPAKHDALVEVAEG